MKDNPRPRMCRRPQCVQEKCTGLTVRYSPPHLECSCQSSRDRKIIKDRTYTMWTGHTGLCPAPDPQPFTSIMPKRAWNPGWGGPTPPSPTPYPTRLRGWDTCGNDDKLKRSKYFVEARVYRHRRNTLQTRVKMQPFPKPDLGWKPGLGVGVGLQKGWGVGFDS